MRRVLGQIFSGPSFLLVFLEALLIAGICVATFHAPAVLAGTAGTKASATVAVALPVAIIALMYSGGLYDREALFNLKRAFWRAAVITGPIFGLAVLATGILAKNTSVPIYPYRWEWTIGLTGIWLVSALILRFVFHEVHRSGYFRRAVLFVGNESEAAELSELASLPTSGFQIIAKHLCRTDDGHKISAEALMRDAVQAGISEIVVGSSISSPAMQDDLLNRRPPGLHVTNYLDFCETEGGRICINSMNAERLALSDDFKLPREDGTLRRGVDILFALATVIATAPVLLLTAIMVKLQDGGPILYRQERVGLHGKSFTLLKFRSMRLDAERDGPAWAAERDSRITPFGRLIRKVRIDELPQFFNVLLGQMAVVGPRPERPCFVRQFSETIPFYDYRHLVKPGITGWAQVSFRYGASLEDTKRKLSYDLYYVKNRSITLDLMILLKTIGVVVRGDGAR